MNYYKRMKPALFGINLFLALFVSLVSIARADGLIAVLEQVQGTIMIDHGDGYAIANAGDDIRPGDRILVLENSRGKLVNGDCVLNLSNNSIHTIRQQSPCQVSGRSVKYIGPLYAAAIGIVKPETKPEEIEKPPQAATPDTAATPDAAATTDTDEQEKVVEQTPTDTTKSGAAAKGPSPKAIAIGVGIAAALAAIGGGGGGGNASTPDH